MSLEITTESRVTGAQTLGRAADTAAPDGAAGRAPSAEQAARRVGHPRREGRGERTCVGCGRATSAAKLVRVIVGPDGALGVDLAGGAFGRGAWLHAAPACVAKAPRGLSRSFRQPITTDAVELGRMIAEAARRRAGGLVVSACRTRQIEVGAEQAGRAMGWGQVHLLLVAEDAAAAVQLPSVERAVGEGRAVAWGNKQMLGSLVDRAEVGVLGIKSVALASKIKEALMIAGTVRPGAVATEDR